MPRVQRCARPHELYQPAATSSPLLLLLLLPSCPGFNAVRVPMNFTNLQRDIPKPKLDGTEFYACMVSDN
jgi:hypothetical protein